MSAPSDHRAPDGDEPDNAQDETGLPRFKTWNRVYLAVIFIFVSYIIVLRMFQVIFS